MIQNGSQSSHLFTVRVWQEKLSEEVVEVRFQVKHVLSGESRVFRDGEQLLRYLMAKLGESGDKDETI